MAFKRVPQKFTATVNEVTIGTGDKAITLGGENVLPLYSFDAPIANKARVGVQITDSGYDKTVPGIAAFAFRQASVGSAGCPSTAIHRDPAQFVSGWKSRISRQDSGEYQL